MSELLSEWKRHFFDTVENWDGTYRIECNIVIYRAKFDKHPKFLASRQGNKHDGYNTKFWFVIEDNLSREDAESKCEQLNSEYGSLIYHCENTGDWDSFPFKENEIVFYK